MLYLIINWIILRLTGAGPERIVQLFITALPLLVGAMVLCGVFRFAVGRYLRVTQTGPDGKRNGRLAGLIAIVIVVGMLPGLFSRFDQNSQNVILAMDERLQAVASNPTSDRHNSRWRNSLPFKIILACILCFTRVPSASVPSALDVTIRYEDGYAITCLVPTADPYVQYFKQCFPGNNVKLP